MAEKNGSRARDGNYDVVNSAASPTGNFEPITQAGKRSDLCICDLTMEV